MYMCGSCYMVCPGDPDVIYLYMCILVKAYRKSHQLATPSQEATPTLKATPTLCSLCCRLGLVGRHTEGPQTHTITTTHTRVWVSVHSVYIGQRLLSTTHSTEYWQTLQGQEPVLESCPVRLVGSADNLPSGGAPLTTKSPPPHSEHWKRQKINTESCRSYTRQNICVFFCYNFVIKSSLRLTLCLCVSMHAVMHSKMCLDIHLTLRTGALC